jgi:predicted nucleotidyltransferase
MWIMSCFPTTPDQFGHDGRVHVDVYFLLNMAHSRLGKQITETITLLHSIGARYALIGGLALALHKIIRATQDVDLLVDATDADRIERALKEHGYHCLHRSADAANYLRGDERVDLLYARRPLARELLNSAAEVATAFGDLRVVGAEGLIGFKLQGWVNDSNRTQDLEDIRALLRSHRHTLDMQQVREYFRLFNRESLLDELLRQAL